MKFFYKIYPWYNAITLDILFYIAIDTMFLGVVKGFSASQISLFITISLISGVIFQFFVYKIVNVLGNEKSVKLGTFLFTLGIIILTIGPNFIIVSLGKIITEFGLPLIAMCKIIARNNLSHESMKNDFISLQAKSHMLYAILTMVIALIIGVLFNINNYLPMICAVIVGIIAFGLSFYIKDYSDKKKEVMKNSKIDINFSKLVIVIICFYVLLFTVIFASQEKLKLFIQFELLESYSLEKTALILGGIVFASRIVRVISNITFLKVYKKFENKLINIVTVILFTTLLLALCSQFFTNSLIIRISLIAIGYFSMLFVRDPINIYLENLALDNVLEERKQNLVITMGLFRKLGAALISFIFSLILLEFDLIVVVAVLFSLATMQLFLGFKLYKMISFGYNKKGDINE